MQAVVKTKAGKGNIELQDVPEPNHGRNEVKIEVKAAGICGSDIHIWDDDIKIPVHPPVIIGHEFSGIVAEIGDGVKGLKIGEGVVSETTVSSCGICSYCREGRYNLCNERRILGYWVNGAFTKFCIVPKERVHKLSPGVDFHSAALTEPLACCVHGVIELTGVSSGDIVVVAGPGAIGLLAMQVANSQGGRVIVCGTSKDSQRLALAKELGAEAAIDIQKEDIREIVKGLSDGIGADVVLECSGAPQAVDLGLELVRKGGKYTQVGLFGRRIEVDFEKVAYKEIAVKGTFSHKWTSWELALKLLSQGKVVTKPLISNILPINKWEEGFNMHRAKEGIKILLIPGSAASTNPFTP